MSRAAAVKRTPAERARDLTGGMLALSSIDKPHIAVAALSQALGATIFQHFLEIDREEVLQLAMKQARKQLRELEARGKGTPGVRP